MALLTKEHTSLSQAKFFNIARHRRRYLFHTVYNCIINIEAISDFHKIYHPQECTDSEKFAV